MTPLPAARVLDQFYLDARSRVLDLAATLDRIGRAGDAGTDPRVMLLKDALAVLLADAPNRAERVQHIFSLAYDPGWERPKPRI